MADYTIVLVLVEDILPGGGLRVLRNGTVTIKSAADDAVLGTATTNSNGRAVVTSPTPTIYYVTANGFVSDHITAGSILESAAAAALNNDAGVASFIADTSPSSTRAALNTAMGDEAADGTSDLRTGLSPVFAGKVGKGDLLVNVKDYGAKGDGTTIDGAAINAAIIANPGRTIYLSAPLGAKTYLVDATLAGGSTPNGIVLNQAGTRLLLDPGAIIKVQPNSADNYWAVTVTAADCTIEGGTILGDVGSHTGSTGEWGHLIVANAGSDRLRIKGVKVTKAWGDGIILQGGAADQSVIDCIADDNRRQGMSITSAVRPRVIGGSYQNTGLTANTAPSAGIDVEPNAGNSVTDCQIVGVTFAGNRGPGLLVSAPATALAEVTVTGGRSVDSTAGEGMYLYATAPDVIRAKVVGLHCEGNATNGFTVTANKVELTACTARANTMAGFQIGDSDCTMSDPIAVENGRNGITIATASIARTRIIGGVTRANGQTATNTYINLDNFGTNTTIIGHMCDAGQLTNKPNWGYVIRTGSTARLIGCDVAGTFGAVNVLDQVGTTPMFPKPGVAKQTLSAAATDATTTQTLANSLRTALINLGYGA